VHSLLYILLALLGLTFLVFIHELGHYILAKRQGMKIEVFSIGFGKPIVSWMRKGIKWQICFILVGGYVKIAGMDKEEGKEPYEVDNGFYSKSPWSRIKVALAGPVVNLVFALVAFGLIWVMGGREKPFSEFTKLIGWMDPESELYENGVRPGDEITEYNGENFEGFKDLIYVAVMNGHPANIEGNKINYFQEVKTPYDYTLKPYESPLVQKGLKTIGVLAPASYLIYNPSVSGEEDTYFQHSPMAHSGIKPNDQLVWADGELIFSLYQLIHVMNQGKALLTVEREGKTFLAKVPRLPIADLRLSREELTELSDWGYEAALGTNGASHYFIPYTLNENLRVEKPLHFVTQDSKLTHISKLPQSSALEILLEPGDQILAVDGKPVTSGPTCLKALQTHQVQLIVKRDADTSTISWEDEDKAFEDGTNWDQLLPIAKTIGTKTPVSQNGNFHLLNSVTPVALKDFPFPETMKKEMEAGVKKELENAQKIADPEMRAKALKEIENSQKRLVLGVHFQDRSVIYNPNPFSLFGSVFQEISRNLIALVFGYFSPKYFGGPVFIVQVMKQSWAVGIKEALFWLGAISLNLGVLNLLPIPVLDGGHICFSLLEKIRKRPLTAKAMQRLTIPFVMLLIFVFIYLTYNDLSRIFGRFF
jgi:regulator of sigma E protease